MHGLTNYYFGDYIHYFYVCLTKFFIAVNARWIMKKKPVIEVRDLCKKFHVQEVSHATTFAEEVKNFFSFSGRSHREMFYALQDISFSIDHGESVGIIGANGAGKSTLLKVLSGITSPSSGSVTLRGTVASILDVGAGFHPELSGRENIYLSGTLQGLSRRDLRARFDDIVAFSGVEKFLDTPLKHYSSGMQVRLGFSIISHLESHILITDEVLAVGDINFQKQSLEKMKETFRQGRTVLFVSHIQPMISAITQRCLWLDKGKLIMDGPTNEVVNQYFFPRETTRAFFKPSPEKPVKYGCITCAGIRDDGGNILDRALEISHSATVFMEFHITYNPGTHLRAVLEVRTPKGFLAFVSDHPILFEQFDPQGSARAECRIPGNLLNQGQYFISLSLVAVSPAKIKLFEYQNCLSFTITDYNKEWVKEFIGDYTGWIRPKLEWNLRKISAAPPLKGG